MSESRDETPQLSLLHGSGGSDGGEVKQTDASIVFHTLGAERKVPSTPVDVAEEILRVAALESAVMAEQLDLPDPVLQIETGGQVDAADPAVEEGLSVPPMPDATPVSGTRSVRRDPQPWRSVCGWFFVILVLGDILNVAAATWIVIAVVSEVKGHDMLVHTTTVAAVLGVLGWVATVAFLGGYAVRRPGFRGGALREALGGSAVVLGILTSMRAIWGVGLPVAAIVFIPLVVLCLGAASRVVVRRAIRRARGQGRWLTSALVVSTNDFPEALVRRLDERTGHGMLIVGVCADHAISTSPKTPVLGGVEDTCEIARQHSVDMVVIDCDNMSPERLRQLLWKLEKDHLAAVIAPPIGEIDPARISIMPTMDSTLMGVQLGGRLSGWMIKWAFDKVVGTILLCLLAPVLLGSAVAVAVSSRGPVFFRQVRVGRDGKPFRMWKFRSMYIDAEARKADLLAGSEGAGLLFKMKNDPRVTPVGKVLRRYSIDELPQLFNVVLGQMALVGPRPALPQEVAEYDWSVSQRLKVRPGMTGLWQVSGRSNLSWEESVRLDLRYADNWSIRMDLAILYATVGAVFGGEGAY